MKPPPESGPLLPLIVQRKRLHHLLNRVALPGIVVVNAQAAQGKTTLIADYVETKGGPSGWMTLAPADADAAYFGRHLAEVLRPHTDTANRAPAEAAQHPATDTIARLCACLPPDISLVFDGWHHLGSTALANERIATILASRPAQSCIFLISREDLPLALQRDRMRRQALMLIDQDLAFTPAEIDAFFSTICDVTLDGKHREKIHRLTAGWAGGLVFLAEQIQRHPGDPEAVLAAPAMPERLQAEAGRYFREEVYRSQPEAMQAFLTGSALLDEAPAELMHRLFGQRQAEQLAAEAARQHLFVKFGATSSGGWTLQMNPLFRAYLGAQARTTLSDEKRHQMLIEAARYCEAGDELESAAGYYLQADDWAAAARTITTIGMERLIEGRFETISPWIARLPAASIRDDPWLSLLQAATFRIKGGRRTIAELQRAHRTFARREHIRGQMLALAYLIETAVFSGDTLEDLTPRILEGEALLETTRRLPHFTFAKALLWQQIGLGTLADLGGDLQRGISACENAVVLGKRIDNRPLVVNALTIAAYAHVQSGEFDQARKCLEAAQATGSGDRFPEYGALRTLVEFHLALIAARLTEASAKLEQAQAAIDRFGMIRLYPSYLEALGLMQIHRKQYAALEKTHRHLHDVAILLNNAIHRAVGYWLAGLGSYHQERFKQARELMRLLTRIPDLPVIQQARNQSLKGFIALNTGQFAEAETHLTEALSIFEERGLALYACEARIGLALVKNAVQDFKTAQRLLGVAFGTAAHRHYDKFHVIRPVDLARACALAIQHEMPSVVDHARHLLANRLDEAEIQTMVSSRSTGPLARSLDARETRHAVYRARIPLLVIRTLGGLQILRSGTEPLSNRPWQGSRPALLFKAILVHGGRHIPKDILLEAVWPDHHPDNSKRNFKVTLHRLRKMLEPDLASARGSSYIHLKDNLVSLDKDLCQVDTDALHRLCKRARRMDAAVDTRELLTMRQEASTLYQGDFLPEEPYLTWAEMKRTTLRQEFIQLMYRLGRRLHDRHEFRAARQCYRQVVRIDPGQEKAQRRLMRLLNAAGRTQEALQVYDALHAFLQTEIGASPDTATVALYDMIRGRLAADRGGREHKP